MSIKSAISRMLPTSAREFVWALSDPEFRRRRNAIRDLRQKQSQAAKLIAAQTGGVVATGPFQGTKYPTDGGFPQKLLGTYELELHGVLNEIAKSEYDAIIDIGAAEGFYVCGCAKLFPKARVIAFEANEKLHPVIREQTRRNEIDDRVELRGLCLPEDLAAVISNASGRVLVICDIEGAEDAVLDPERSPQLGQADLLVEVHDLIVPGLTETLSNRFRLSHEVEVISSRPRTVDDFPKSIELPAELKLLSMEESRGEIMNWLWLKSRASRGR